MEPFNTWKVLIEMTALWQKVLQKSFAAEVIERVCMWERVKVSLVWNYLRQNVILGESFPTYRKSVADDFDTVYFNPFPHTTILQQTTLNVFCQNIENLHN